MTLWTEERCRSWSSPESFDKNKNKWGFKENDYRLKKSNHLHSNRLNPCFESEKMSFKMKHVGSHYIFNGYCELSAKGSPPSSQPAIKAKLPEVRLTDGLTDPQITVCLCNLWPFLTSLADWRTHPYLLRHQCLLIWQLSCLIDSWDILPRDPAASVSPLTIKVIHCAGGGCLGGGGCVKSYS